MPWSPATTSPWNTAVVVGYLFSIPEEALCRHSHCPEAHPFHFAVLSPTWMGCLLQGLAFSPQFFSLGLFRRKFSLHRSSVLLIGTRSLWLEMRTTLRKDVWSVDTIQLPLHPFPMAFLPFFNFPASSLGVHREKKQQKNTPKPAAIPVRGESGEEKKL